MNYTITEWDGEKDLNIKLTWNGFELDMLETYYKEFILNYRYQIHEN